MLVLLLSVKFRFSDSIHLIVVTFSSPFLSHLALLVVNSSMLIDVMYIANFIILLPLIV
jgi:hypothetical protein